MTDIQNLRIEGNKLLDDKGSVVAEVSDKLSSDIVSAYARALASASEMLEMLRKIAGDAVAEYEAQYSSAMEFNNRANVPSLGPSPMNIPEFPDWLKDTLSLIAKIDGEE